MEMNIYQELARRTDMNTKINGNEWMYYALGLVGESGEIANKLKKAFRDKNGELDKEAIIDELGDCLWYISTFADHLGYSLEDLAQINVNKLESRMKRGQLHGAGDKR